MTLPQCKAVVLYGRDAKGNRGGLIPPRHCQRPATTGDYCGVHARQAEMQDLLRDCLSPSWETEVKLWEARRTRQAELEGQRVARGLADIARRHGLSRAAAFLSFRSAEVGRVWAEGL